MQESKLQAILEGFGKLRIAVLGDFCLDALWFLDQQHIEYSLETGKITHAVSKQSYFLGGAGNVVKNLVDIGVGEVWAFGVIGEDVFGRQMLQLLSANDVRTDGMVVQHADWDTSVYAKPHVGLEEQERIDFGRFNVIAEPTVERIMEKLEKQLPELDGLIINQQLAQGIHNDSMIRRLGRLIRRFQDKVILLDARDISDRYDNVICKINAGEAAKLCGVSSDTAYKFPTDQLIDFAKQIYQRNGREVIITQSERGVVAYDGRNTYQVPGILIVGRIDPCGAGDTTAAAITAALSHGATLSDAIELGNYAAAVIVRKINQTGTATPREILAMASGSDYIYNPELAENARTSQFWKNTEIEVIEPQIDLGRIKYAIFDNDGTISTLRQGWEQIMEPVMVRAILGPRHNDVTEQQYQQVVQRVREYIDQSTGIETIIQMDALTEMVKEFGFVDPSEISTPLGYKDIYNRQLLNVVTRRISKLQRSELEKADYTIKGAKELLHDLCDRGVKLYLTSGTDHDDTVREAMTLGYARFFEEIHGWDGKTSGSPKQMVLERLIREHNLCGPELVCFGDGPVELRLCKKVGGITVGVASDEVRRYGLNRVKRTRLVKAGADIIIPDFTQREALLDLLFNHRTVDISDLKPRD